MTPKGPGQVRIPNAPPLRPQTAVPGPPPKGLRIFGGGPPYAEVVQIGRWVWWVTVHHGTRQWGPDGDGWRVWGNRERADRVAGRKLAQYLREEKRAAQTTHRVTG